MLFQKGFQTGDVVTFKLTSGEEMIARYQGETMTEYQITKPATLLPTERGTFGFVPSIVSGELNSNTMNLQKTAVVLTVASQKEVADKYTEITSSIKPASSLAGVVKNAGDSL